MNWKHLFSTDGKLSHLKVGGWLLLLLFIGVVVYSVIVHKDVNSTLDRVAWMLAGVWGFRVVNYVAEKIKPSEPTK